LALAGLIGINTNTASEFSGTLVLLLRDVDAQPWLDVFTVLPVHALLSPFVSSGNAVYDWAHYRERNIDCHSTLMWVGLGAPGFIFH
jgi:hypothetical protein